MKSCGRAAAAGARQSIEDVLAAVGRGEMFSGDVVKAVYPDFKEERKTAAPAAAEPGWFRMQKASRRRSSRCRAAAGATRKPCRSAACSGDLPVSFAPNGGAVPGDRIVGIMTPGEGITVYPIQSPALAAFDDQPERWLDVRWDVEDAQAAVSGADHGRRDQRAGQPRRRGEA